jgi:CSLREA domain-containing protein
VKHLSPDPSPHRLQVFVACLLAFAILITPIAAVAVPSRATVATRGDKTDKTDKTNKPKSAAEELFVNPPVAPATETSAALPGPKPEPAPEPFAPPVGAVTATMTAAVTATGNNGDGKADPGDTINYTVQLGNASGSDATGLSFNPALDSHTTFVPGSIKSTPICFDQTGVSTNEDTAKAITLTGQDPDGDAITFSIVTAPTNGGFGATTAPNLTYTPNADFFGSDSFTFRVNDGTTSGAGNNGNSNETCTVSITVNAVNDAPTFTIPGNPTAVNEDAGAQSVSSFITGVRPAQVGNTTEDTQTVSFVITNNTNAGLFSSAPALNVVGASYPKTATLTYTSAANQNGTATITYHAHDTGGTANGGVDNSADQTFTITVNPVNDPPVVVAPAAFAVQANMKRTGLTGLLANVTDVDTGTGSPACDPTPFTVTSGSIGGPAASSVSNVNLSTGTFDFDPPAGVTGPVTFTYTVSDNGCPGVAISAPVTVTVNIAGPVIWFVNTTLGAAGNGTLNTPFNTLAGATAAMGLNANQRIFVFGGSTTASGTTVTLQGNNSQATQALAQVQAQWLIGQGVVAASFDTFFGITPPAGTIARPAVNGTRPTIQGTVNMKENTVVQGLNINVSAGGTKGLTNPGALSAGTSGSTLTIKDVNVTSAGGNAVDFSSAQTINYTTSNSSTSPNVLLSTTGIALNVVNTTIGASGVTFKSISAGTAASGPSSGIVLNNTGSTAGVTVTGSGSASAGGDSSGGTIQKTTSSAILLTSTKNASFTNMNIQNTAGSGVRGTTAVTNFTFTNGTINNSAQGLGPAPAGNQESSIAFNDPSGSATDAKVTGTVTITGNTLTNALWHGVSILQFDGLLDDVNISNNTMTSGTTTATGGNSFGSGIQLVPGGVAATSSNLTRAELNNNTINNFPGGVLIAVQCGTAANSPAPTAKCGTVGSASNDIEIKNNLLKGNGTTSNGAGGFILPNQIMLITVNGRGEGQFTIQNNGTVANPLSGSAGNVIDISAGGAVTVQATVTGNTMNAAGQTVGGTSGIAAGVGPFTVTGPTVLSSSTLYATVQNNVVNNSAGSGIRLNVNAGSPTLNAIVTNNTVGAPISATYGIQVQQGNNAGFTGHTNLQIASNTSTGGTGGGNTFPGTGLRKFGTTIGEYAIVGMSPSPGTNAQMESSISALNPGSALGTFGNRVTAINGSSNNWTAIASVPQPPALPLLAASGGVEAAQEFASSITGFYSAPVWVSSINVLPSLESDVRPARSASSTVTASLNQQQLDTIVAAAIERWSATGLTHQQVAILQSLKFEVADLSGAYLGEADSNRVLVARDASGKGWFVDASPLSDASFARSVSVTRRYTNPWSLPAGHVDLLTAIAHEMGHKLGLDDSYAEKDRDNLMYGYLTVGERRLPSKGQAPRVVSDVNAGVHFLKLSNEAQSNKKPKATLSNHAGNSRRSSKANRSATAMSPMPFSGGTFPINGTGSGFSLPNGKTITIKFSVTLNNPPNLSGVPPATPQVSSQGTLSGAFIGNPIVTDDPGTIAANDATVTLVDLFDTTTSLGAVPAAGSWNVGQSVTFTATVASNPPGNPTAVTGSVIFKDNGTAISGCNGVALSSAQAQCVTTFGSGAHSVTAVYSGDGNFDPSTSSALSQGAVSASGTSTAVTSSLNPSLVTQNVTFTATVTSTSGFAGPPTGTVTFKDGVNPITCSNVGGQALNGSGVATCQIATLPAGSHSITAVYPGDTNFTTSTGTLTGDPQVVNKSDTTTLLTSSSNPVAPTVQVTYTATVSSSTSVTGPPSGTVTFKDGVTTIVCEAGSQALTAGVATCKFTYPDTVGSPHDITAVYGGDATFNGNTSNHVSEVIQSCSASVVVTSNADSGANTLRDAINNGVCDGGTITFDPSVTSITLTTGELAVSKNMTINGPGAAALTISGNNTSRVFNVAVGKTVIISGMTLTSGKVTGANGAAGSAGVDAKGGGVFNAGTLTLSNVILSGSHATGGDGGSNSGAGAGGAGGNGLGGGIFNSGTLTLTNTTVNGGNSATGGKGGDTDPANANGNGGSAFGGGVYSSGTLTLTNSTISGNSVAGGAPGAGGTGGVSGNALGGGICNDGSSAAASATITGSTISGNTSSVNGGGIANVGTGTNATLTLTNTTISGNGANNDGGGIYNDGATGTTTLTSVTVTGNTTDKDDLGGGAGGGLNIVSGTFTLRNTIVAGNLKGTATPTAHDITGTINTSGSASSYNLIGDAASSGGLTDGTDHNIVGNAGAGTIDILTVLNPTLADNGGPTKTHALVGGSPALEKGNAFGLTTDQRGFPRPVDFDATPPVAPFDDTDIGAFESQLAPNAPGAPNLDAASDSGANNADDKTNVTTNLSFTIPGVVSGANVQLFRDGSPVASGVASGSSIQLIDPGPLTFTASGTTYSYTAKQSFGTDTSVASTALPVLITIIPDAPVLDPASDSGTLGDGITNDTSPTFNITNVVNTATVKLFRDGVEVASGTAAGTTIQLTDPSAPNGTFTYTAKQIFNAVTSDPSAGISITITIKPSAPDLDAASDTGTSNTDNYTNDTTPTFTINGVINGANVELLRDGTSVANGTAAGTSIQLTDPGATAGLHTYKARQTVGITLSPDSDGLDVTIDTGTAQPSTPDLITADDSNINNDNVTSKTTPTFTGTAEANSSVQLFATGVLKGSTTADGSGNWSITSIALADGPYNITVVATDAAGNVSLASSALPIVIDTIKPSVAMSSAVGNPTATTPIPVTVTFNESVTGFTIGDIVPGNGTVGNFAGGPAVYTFDLTPTSPGPVSADIAGGVAIDLAGNTNTAATQFNRTFDPSALSVTITPVSPDPRNTSVSSIQIVFNKAVTGFDLADLTLKLNGGANLLTGAQTLTSGDNITWTLGNLSGLTGTAGTYVLKLTAAGSNIKDAANNLLASDATESWVMDTTAPDVTINQAVTQIDPVTGPTASTVINFTAIFNEPVAAGSFTNSDVTISGTAGATVVNVTEIAPNDGTHFNVAIEGMTQSGTVIASIPAGAAQDAAGNGNTVSTSTDNTVTYFKDDFTTLVVNSLADTDDGSCAPIGTGNGCTLREAINAANADAGAETITFDPNVFSIPGPHLISLLTALPVISTDMTIQGPGANVLTVERNSGAGLFRIFNVPSGTVTISGLTITKGFLPVGGQGGGVFNLGTLTLSNDAISANQLTGAGSGGGVYNGGGLTINGSTINGNQALNTGSGGGIFNVGTLTINNSTISGNLSAAQGGGIFTSTNLLTINSGTITGNVSNFGGGIYSASIPVVLRNTIVGGGNSAGQGPDIFGAVQSGGFNLIPNIGGAVILPGPGPDIFGKDPLLFPLADNGGPTRTHALQCTSPAIDKGKAFTLTTDQRGGVRPFDLADAIYPNAAGGDGSDIGAYETQSGGGCLPLAVPPAPPPSTNEDTQVTITLKGTYSQNFPLTFAITQQPGHATANLVPAGTTCTFTTFTECTATVSYTPTLNFNGLDSFKFKVSAGGLDSDEVDVNITVNPVNDPPVANPQSVVTDEDTPLNIFLSGSDVDSASLSFIIVTPPAHGSFGATTAPNLTYTPTANYNGPDSFTFKINDGSADSNIATVAITVNAVNDAPSFTKGPDQTVNGAVAQTVAGWATNISAGPPDESAQTLTFLVSNNNNAIFSVQPAISPTGTLTFTPAYGFDGTATVTVQLHDSGGTALGGVDTSAPQTFTITVHALNNAPTLNALADVIINEDAPLQTVSLAGITSGPSYESGQTLTVTATSSNPALIPNPSVSYTSPNTTGSISFTPLPDANGSVLITVSVKDDGGTANGGVDTFVRTFTVTVNPVNDPPVNHVPGAQNIPLNALFVFSSGTGNAIFISDVDAGSDPVQVTLKATDGTLTLNGTAGLSFTVGDGTDDPLMTFTGSIANINAALEGMKNLAFGSGVITITTNDLGHNGIGGPLSDTDTIQVTVVDNLAPVLLTIPGTDRAIAFDSTSFVIDPFNLQGNSNFIADFRTHIMLFALHAQLRPGETASAITAEADVDGTIVPLTVESVMTVPNFDWLTQIVVRFPDGFSTGGGGPHDAKIRIHLRGQTSNQAVIIIVPAPRP